MLYVLVWFNIKKLPQSLPNDITMNVHCVCLKYMGFKLIDFGASSVFTVLAYIIKSDILRK